MKKLVEQYPNTSIAFLKAFDEVYQGKLEIEDFPLVQDFVKTVLQSLSGKQKSMVDLQLDVLGRLSKEKRPEGMQRLLKLLEQYELPQLTSVTSIITDRLQKLRVFEAEIQNEKAYEIKGPNSIHNQLKESLWIIDDSYWLLRSNEPLTSFLHKKFSKGKPEERDRPDFICSTLEGKLVIVELKRPGHKIGQKDVTQLQNYLITADDFKEYGDKTGFIIGKSIEPRVQKIVKQIPIIHFVSYSSLVEECNRRYQQYLDAIKDSTNAQIVLPRTSDSKVAS